MAKAKCPPGKKKVGGKCIPIKMPLTKQKSIKERLMGRKMGPRPDESPTLRDKMTKSKKWKKYKKKY